MRPERGLSSLTVSAVTVAVLLLLYPLSFGPACWLGARVDHLTGKWISIAYAPLIWGYDNSSEPFQQAFLGYANFGNGGMSVRISGGEVGFLPVSALTWGCGRHVLVP